jgi:hypothetical protein
MAQKVGLLDDPVWSEPAPQGVRPKRRASKTRYQRRLIAVLATATIAVVISVLVMLSGHSGGDPGGQALGQIRSAVAEAIPPGSTLAGSEFVGSQWQGCGYEAGTSGWSEPTGGTAFRTGRPDAAVQAYVSANLKSHGWNEASGPTATSGVWTKTLNGGSMATLRLVKGFAIPDGWTAWADAVVGGSCPGSQP